MLTVTVSINGSVIAARTVMNTGTSAETSRGALTRYRSDDGTIILHLPSDGAIKLAIAALETIKEWKGKPE